MVKRGELPPNGWEDLTTLTETPSKTRSRWAVLAVAIFASIWFGWRLDQQPFFADEAAYIAYSHYLRLIGSPNDENWLHFAAYDSPPLYKYLIGASLHLCGRQTPTSIVPAEQWLAGNYAPPRDPVVLRAARLPMLLGAVLGCVAIYLCAAELVGVKTGLLAATFLATSPLYYVHARRAMADDLTQAFVMLALWSFCRAWKCAGPSRVHWMQLLGWSLACGLFAGLGLSTKLNALTAIVSIIATTVAAVTWSILHRRPSASALRNAIPAACAATLALSMAGGVFIGVNPFFYGKPKLVSAAIPLTDQPPKDRLEARHRQMAELAKLGLFQRVRFMFEYRRDAQSESIKTFSDYALRSIPSRLHAMLFEGIGRWTMLGNWPDLGGYLQPVKPTPRRGDALPPIALHGVRIGIGVVLVVLGVAYAFTQGRREFHKGGLPSALVFLVWALVEVTVLTQSLTLDWDRYYMGEVCIVTLLLAVGIGGTLVRIGERIILAPPDSETES